MFSMKTPKSQYLKTIIFSTALSLVGSGYALAQIGNGDKEIGKLADSCILVKKSNNLKNLEELALNLPDGFVWIEENSSGNYELKARLNDLQINSYKEKLGNLNYISCDTNYSDWVIKREKLTLKDLGYTDDLYIEGNNPYFKLTFPLYKTFEKGKFFINFSVSPIINEKSSIAIKLNNKIVKIFRTSSENNAFSYGFIIDKNPNKTHINIALDGYLRAGENICDDLNSKNLYMRVDVNKTGFYVLRNLQVRNIKNFFEDYNKNFFVEKLDSNALKLAYYIPASIRWLKVNVLPINQEYTNGNKAIFFSDNNTYVSKSSMDDILHINNPDIVSPEGIKSLLVSSASKIEVKNRTENILNTNEISLRDLGIKTQTINGVGVLSIYVPFDTARVGGIPDKLHLVLRVSSSAVDEHDRVNLELMVNGGLVKSYAIREATNGVKEYDIEIPSSLIQAGTNNIYVKLNYYPSSDRCIGAVPKINLTLFDDSYFYWNETKKEVSSIRDFINIVNGRVAVVVDDNSFYPYALRFLNILGQLNSNIEKIDILNSVEELDNENKNYDYIIIFSKTPQPIFQKVDVPLKIDEKGFEIVDIERNKKLFSFKPEDEVGIIEVFNYKNKPTLLITAVNDLNALSGLNKFNYVNINSLIGNVALINKNDYSTFTIGEKLKVNYISEKGLAYYWNNYKALILTAIAVLVVLFEIFIFRNLVRNKKNNSENE